jgi:hypothetical protein
VFSSPATPSVHFIDSPVAEFKKSLSMTGAVGASTAKDELLKRRSAIVAVRVYPPPCDFLTQLQRFTVFLILENMATSFY